jgi:hypothetical protein
MYLRSNASAFFDLPGILGRLSGNFEDAGFSFIWSWSLDRRAFFCLSDGRDLLLSYVALIFDNDDPTALQNCKPWSLPVRALDSKNRPTIKQRAF